MTPTRTFIKILFYPILLFSLCSCSVQKMALRSVANALTGDGAGVFSSDEDPVLVGNALPFALKTMEALLLKMPENPELFMATARSFVQYTHAFVLQPANQLEYSDFNEAKKGRERSKHLFIRARDYGLQGLDLMHPGFSKFLSSNPSAALSQTTSEDVPALYWTGVAWASSLSVSKDDMTLLGDLPIITALLGRAMQLDEDWAHGALHEFYLVFDAGRPEQEGGGISKAEYHFNRAMELNGGQSIGPLISAAEAICVRRQDRVRFKGLLSQALEFDVNKHASQYRLSNILAQQKAEFLLKNIDNLFIAGDEGGE